MANGINDVRLVAYAESSKEHMDEALALAQKKYNDYKNHKDSFDLFAYYGEIYVLKLAYSIDQNRDMYRAYLYAMKSNQIATAAWILSVGRFNLNKVPDDILRTVIDQLPIEDKANLSVTNKHFRSLIGYKPSREMDLITNGKKIASVCGYEIVGVNRRGMKLYKTFVEENILIHDQIISTRTQISSVKIDRGYRMEIDDMLLNEGDIIISFDWYTTKYEPINNDSMKNYKDGCNIYIKYKMDDANSINLLMSHYKGEWTLPTQFKVSQTQYSVYYWSKIFSKLDPKYISDDFYLDEEILEYTKPKYSRRKCLDIQGERFIFNNYIYGGHSKYKHWKVKETPNGKMIARA